MGSQKQVAFEKGMTVVYPAHGIGKVAEIEHQEIAGFKLELLVVEIPRSKMVLRIPRAKVASSGLRPVIGKAEAQAVLSLLEGRARRSRSLWSKRAQDYDAKINSGDVTALAEVVRDLSRAPGTEDASYSEKTIHENALERLTAELAIALDLTASEVDSLIARHLAKRPTRGGPESDANDETDAAAA